jgi:FemAB-related protein (PEP-CTERM system-associated)
MDVCELDKQDVERWDAYVHTSAHSTVFHLAGWREVMRQAFGLRCHFLLARDNGDVRGVLPLVHVRSGLTGHYITSMPGALCAEDAEAAAALVGRAKDLVKSYDADYLILRDSRHEWKQPELATNEGHCTLLVKLAQDPDEIWMGFNRRVRQSTKKAFRADLQVLQGPEHLNEFYPVYSRAMRDMGTPVLGRPFVEAVLTFLPRVFSVMVVRQGERVLGGGLVAYFRDTVYNTWGGMLREFYDLGPNYILYWETLKYACEQGYRWADLGRSAWDSGTYRFKRHWNAEPQPLYQQTYLNGHGQAPSVGSDREDELDFRLFTAVWRHLPVSVTEFLGPRLRRGLPFG